MAAAVRSRPGSAVGQYAYSATGPPASPPAVGGRAGAGTGAVLAVISVNGRFGPVVESASAAARLFPVAARPPAIPSSISTLRRQPCQAAAAMAS